MSTRLALPPNLLDGRRPPRPRVDGESRSAILQLSQLTDRGECVEAAQQAAEMLRADVYDLRLACVYLVGLFAEQGLTRLPELLRCTGRLLADEAAAPPSMRSTPRVLDTTLQWLFQGFFTHIQFHAVRRDETWTQWLQAGEASLPAALGEEIGELTRVLGQMVERSVSIAVLEKIGRWARGDLARALARTARNSEQEAPSDAPVDERPEPEPEPESEPEPEPEPENLYDDEPEDEPRASHRAGYRRAVPPTESHAPAMAALHDKLLAFEILVEREDFAKAAVVARDVQRIIEAFDPVEFLPSLFAGYFRAMNRRLEELRPHLERADDTPWQVLSRLYQADLEGFLDE